MRILILSSFLVGLCHLFVLGQGKPIDLPNVISSRLPVLKTDRIANRIYLDSLRNLGLERLQKLTFLKSSPQRDTARFETYRYVSTLYRNFPLAARDSALYYAEQLYQQASQAHNRLYQAWGLMLEEMYLRIHRHEYARSIALCAQVKNLCRGLPVNTSPLYQVYVSLGDTYRHEQNHPRAIEQYHLALQLLPQLTTLTTAARQQSSLFAHQQIGFSLEQMGRFEEAFTEFQAVLDGARQLGNQSTIAYSLERLGNHFLARQQPERALPYYQQALPTWIRLKNEFNQAAVSARLAQCYWYTKQFNLALDYGERAYLIAKRLKQPYIGQFATQALYQTYRDLNQFDKALAMHEAYVSFRDSIARSDRLNEVMALQKKYDVNQVKAAAERERFRQQQQLLETRREAQLAQAAAQSKLEKLTGAARETALKQQLQTQRLQAADNLRRLAQQNRIAKLNQAVQAARESRRNLLLGYGAIGLFVLGLLTVVWLISRQRNQIRKINDGLEAKVAERTEDLERANQQLRQTNQEIESALLRGQSFERRLMAADLHDNLGALISAINLSLSSLETETLPGREQQVYNSLRQLTEAAYAEVRFLSHNLHPNELEQAGLLKTLNRLILRLNSAQRIHFDLDAEQLPPLDKAQELHLYAICLELCNNILKHSAATYATIRFERKKDQLRLTVNDNGQGMDEWTSGGVGLSNVKTRTEAMGGTVTWQSGSQSGTTLVVTMPFSTSGT